MSPKCSTKQNDSVKSSQQNNENNEVVHARRERDRCLFCCTPKVLMIISVIYLTLGIIHMITRLAYLNGCRDLYENLDSMVPSNISFDQSITPTLNVNTEYYYNSYDEIWISQSDDVSVTNTTVRIRTATKNSDGGKIVTKNGPFSYNIYLSGGTVMENFASFWTVKCVINRVEVILPQQKVANANAILSSPVNINSYGLDVKFQQNSILYPYSINIKTTSSDIDLENISVTNASIQSTSGDIKGSISSQDELSIESTSGDIKVNANINSLNGSPFVGLKSTSGDIDFELNIPNVVVRPTINISATSGDINTDVKLVSGITDSQITVKTSSGDIGLKLHDSFQGQYQIKTTSGDVSVIPGYDTSHNQKGMIGPVDSQGFLSVEATSGDVEIEF